MLEKLSFGLDEVLQDIIREKDLFQTSLYPTIYENDFFSIEIDPKYVFFSPSEIILKEKLCHVQVSFLNPQRFSSKKLDFDILGQLSRYQNNYDIVMKDVEYEKIHSLISSVIDYENQADSLK
jgi:threonyl-tRNA synthetase